MRKYIHDFYLVSDEDIIEAMFAVWDHMKVLIEITSAIPLAALIKHKNLFRDKNIGIVFSGGNVDFKAL